MGVKHLLGLWPISVSSDFEFSRLRKAIKKAFIGVMLDHAFADL